MDEFILGIFENRPVLKSTTLYQLLVGRRTSSVLVYGCLADLLPFWGLFPRMSEAAYSQTLDRLEADGRLKKDSTGFYHKTTAGSSLSTEKQEVLAALDNFRFNKSGELGWRLIRLAIQTASEYRRKKNFVPLETAPHYTEPVRELIRRLDISARKLLYDELSSFFSALPEPVADNLATCLTGHQINGKADYQTLSDGLLDSPWRELAPRSQRQQFMKLVAEQPTTICGRLYLSFAHLDANQSGLVTRRLFQEGVSMAEVMKQRRLKQGTINDHLIEWALADSEFPYRRFCEEDTLQVLRDLPGDPVAWRYSDTSSEKAVDYRTFVLYQIAAKKKVTECF